MSSTLLAVHKHLPPYRYAQQELAELFVAGVQAEGPRRELINQVFTSTTVQSRHLAIPPAEYARLTTLGKVSDRHHQVAGDLAAQALRAALGRAGVEPRDVDMFITNTSTGIAVPTIDIELAVRLGMRRDVQRMPLFGTGCGGGGLGLARLNDYLRAWPDHTAVLLSVELPSMNWHPQPLTFEYILGTALFGDAVAVVVACGPQAPAARSGYHPRIQATRHHVSPGTTHLAGWRLEDRGIEVILHRDLADGFAEPLEGDVRGFLDDHGLTAGDITAWPCHPGGPKILDNVAKVLGLPTDALDLSRAHLRDCGNCVSASVLHILADTIEAGPPRDSPGLLLSLGPGLYSEMVLLRW
ncbi:type III polyketide synthase [Nonomuraea sp. FMUSA5-5]|uniref:Type III polyketide synthase n=1 Tax=Nonomuraea composti TaxID=2720023 RepID=A0ABX1BVB0_9ACTN|nr:3-oxoacyl-[acyl-carrier-protein] synthase III C-terminal domain-containing protein [Nonomuraea sp. FMUSA5-5]NJP98653.1 type III polyketide synthase [Nonomuraea sp. FMUSA5-5]